MSNELEDGIIELFSNHADKASEVIGASTPLESLGIHSLELTEIVMDIEDKYGVDIDLSTVDSWQSFQKVGDIIDAVKVLVAAKADAEKA